MQPLELALRLTLLTLLLRPVGDGTLRPVFLAVALVGLVWPGAQRRAVSWAALAALAALRVFVGWPFPDNHAYLLCYWCLAAALALRTHDSERTLAESARLLIGLAFGFALLWKLVLSPDFRDGTFFAVWLVSDERFEPVARLAAGLGPEALAELRARLAQHVDLSTASALATAAPARLLAIAKLATAWTLALEGAIAAAFLGARFAALARLRDVLLLAFCATTYAVAPVSGFGWLLLSMGVAQTARESRTRGAYLAVFVLLALYGAFAGFGRPSAAG